MTVKNWKSCFKSGFPKMAHNGSGLCVVALSINLKLTTTLDMAITQSPCYVPLILSKW
jgi:hypothetical protein